MVKNNYGLTLLIPAYNEENLLENAVKYYHSYLKNLHLGSFEIIICVNGSTDNTEGIARQISKKYKEVKYISTKRKGMGIAIKLGIEKASKEIITYMPGDGEIEANFIGKALSQMNNYDFIIGSREKSSYKTSSITRRITTYGFNAAISLLLSSKATEAASVKMFRKEWGKKAAKEFENDGFEWQVEFVYYALRDKLRIGKVPVRTMQKKEKSSVNPVNLSIRLLKSCLKYGLKYRLGI